MPWYEYRCKMCGHEFEAVCTIKEREEQTCPRCGYGNPLRLISSGHFVMDGKMQTLHCNSPDGMNRAKEIKKKHWKKGKKHFQEWVGENKERAKRDKKWSYHE